MTRHENTFLQTVANADNAGFSRSTYAVTRKSNKKSRTSQQSVLKQFLHFLRNAHNLGELAQLESNPGAVACSFTHTSRAYPLCGAGHISNIASS